MSDLLIFCPTLRLRACEMYSSLRTTCVTDPDVFFVSRKGSVTELINEAFNRLPEYKYYHVTNDDFIYRTKGWDATLIKSIEHNNGWGISYGNDLFNGQHLSSVSVISGNIVRALGWLQLPGLCHLYGDSVWKIIGERLGIYYYNKTVIIEHCHFLNKKSEKDEVYERTNSQETYERDQVVYEEWLSKRAQEDVGRIRLAMQS